MGKFKGKAEIGWLFLWLGIIGFGGPPAHLSLMRREFVDKRHWLSEQQFLDIVGATNLVPGPNSTETAMQVGTIRGGNWGLFLSGFGFILPAVVSTWLLAYLYVRFGSQPFVPKVLTSAQPAVVGVLIANSYVLGRKAVKTWVDAVLIGSMVTSSLLGLPELPVLILSGVLKLRRVKPTLVALPILVTPTTLLLFFLQIGLTIYGGGYVLTAYLHGGLVDQLHWLTSRQVLDAVAIGQLTPGPVFSTATFCGYLIGGNLGALLATIGIFAPAFLFAGILKKCVSWLRADPMRGMFLDGVNIGAVALMFAVGVRLIPLVVHDWRSVVLLLASLGTAYFGKVNAGLIVLVSGLLGLIPS